MSKNIVMIKSDKPRVKLAVNPSTVLNKAKVESPTIPIQITPTSKRAFLYDGRKNMDE